MRHFLAGPCAWGLLVALIAALRPEAARPVHKSESSGRSSLDKLNEQLSRLHIKPSTHRAVRRRDEGAPPVLVVTFALNAASSSLKLVLPPGYEPVIDSTLPTSCGIFAPSERANYSVYSRETGAQPVTPHIIECEVRTHHANKKVKEVVLHLCEGIHGLSAPRALEPGKQADDHAWWFFHLQVWMPDVNPVQEENVFELHWAENRGGSWTGSTLALGEPVLGDWDCQYSDWEAWGTCSARCGGGTQKIRRRILVQPPSDGSGVPCKEEVDETISCNMHACTWPCEYSEEVRGECSAECGGGVQMVRMKWHGEHCPMKDDIHSVRREKCNTQPCKAKCRLKDTWTVLTECSEMCGPGYFWMMRSVERKDMGDKTCQPEFRKLPCMKQRCTPLTVVRPDINIHPFPEDDFKAGIIFKVPVQARVIQLNAPEGFKFGKLGGGCTVTDHDLAPNFESCHVGVRESQAVLKLATPVHETFPSDYTDAALHPESEPNATLKAEEFDDYHQFQIAVRNRPCDKGWTTDIMATTLRCDVPSDENHWTIEFGEDGTTRWESESIDGYPIFGPYGSEEIIKFGRASSSDLTDVVTASTAGHSPLGTQSLDDDGRPHFCSPRIPCKEGKCGINGICS